MPSGRKRVPPGSSRTTCRSRPDDPAERVDPVLQYAHFVPGSNSSGHWEIAMVASARVRFRLE
jgi:hypothetical protein